MLVLKKRPLAVEVLYFDFTQRLSSGETLLAVLTQPTMSLPTVTNADLTFTTVRINTAGAMVPPYPQSPIQMNLGAECTVSGGLLPTDPTQITAILPDGTIGTIYQFSFSVQTSAILDGVNRVIDEQYQLWVSNDDYPSYWTSHAELNRRFGKSNVTQWADVENTRDQTQILNNVWAAVAEATDEFRCQLRGSACGPISSTLAAQSFLLRLNVTRMAASILYSARGVKDTSDEEGRDRLSSARKAAEKFIKRCRAGHIRLTDGDVGVTTHPVVVSSSQRISAFGPLRTPEQILRINQQNELIGVPNYNWWITAFDQPISE